MKKKENSITVNKLCEKNGISFYEVHSDKFKTVRLDIYLIDSLQKEKAGQNALISSLLRRGCRRYPTQQELALALEELYGAGIDTAVYKKGENQLIHISASFVSDRFTTEKTRLFDEVGGLMLEILTEPVLDNGLFLQDYFEQERENLIQRIRSRVNDKMYYAFMRCMEEMCAEEPFAVHEDGDEDSVKAITREGLALRYKELLEHSPIYVYISGNVHEDEIQGFIGKFDRLERKNIDSLSPIQAQKAVGQVRRVEEPMDVSQGKLCLGFRTQIEANSPDYYPLTIYNGILGGGIQSKLFQNVREKESLAYSSYSRLEKFKGLMVVLSGIEIANREKAEKITMEQLKAIEKGDISELEMEASKKTLETGLKSMQDSQGQMADFFLSQHLSKVYEDIDTFLERLIQVTNEDVVRVSGKITLDTIYFLTSLESVERSKS